MILFSHGFGGNKDAFGPIAKHWASHGYVVIHPSHNDGVNRDGPGRGGAPARDGAARRRRPFPAGGGGRLLGGLNDPQKIGGRVADVIQILDSLAELPKAVPALAGKMDVAKVGVGGHSFGAYTAMLLGGVMADLGGVKNKSFFDKRVACILPISAQGTGQQGLTEQSWEKLHLPMMTITGTLDRGARPGCGVEEGAVQYSPPGDKYLVVIDGAHVSFGGNLGTAPPRGGRHRQS